MSEYVNVIDAAAAMGVSERTVYKLCATNKLIHSRVGLGRGTIRISKSAIAEYLNPAPQPEDQMVPESLTTTEGLYD